MYLWARGVLALRGIHNRPPGILYMLGPPCYGLGEVSQLRHHCSTCWCDLGGFQHDRLHATVGRSTVDMSLAFKGVVSVRRGSQADCVLGAPPKQLYVCAGLVRVSPLLG